MLSYSYPPLVAPESILAAKAVRSMAADVDVISCAPTRPWQTSDLSAVAYAEEAAAAVHRIEQPLWLPIAQPTRRFRRFPDAMRFVHRRALTLATRLHEQHGYDALMTWGQWHSVHLVGLAIKRRWRDLPWIAHFSDPWAGNPLIPLGVLTRHLAHRWEHRVMAWSDAIEFTTDEAAFLTMSRYPTAWGRKVAVVPHAYDPTLYPPIPLRRGGQVVIRSVGSFYGDRQPHPLLHGIRALLLRSPAGLDGVELEIIGAMPAEVRTTLPDRIGPVPITLRRHVPYEESLRLMRDADVLVAVDAPAARSVRSSQSRPKARRPASPVPSADG
jgi:hypothetical protein